jgi:hypothetical protein
MPTSERQNTTVYVGRTLPGGRGRAKRFSQIDAQVRDAALSTVPGLHIETRRRSDTVIS